MPKFKKTESQLENELEEWLYILNNLNTLNEIPLSLRGKEEYESVFKIAEVGNLTPKQMNEYQQSLKIQRDNNSALMYAKKEGIEIGVNKKAIDVALLLKSKQIAYEIIAEVTGLSLEKIGAL